MSVLDRLAALRQPLWSDVEYEEWRPLEGAAMPAVVWRPRSVRFKGVLWSRIREASRGWSLRHMYRNLQVDMVKAISLSTPEAEWFRKVRNIQPSGREHRWGDA